MAATDLKSAVRLARTLIVFALLLPIRIYRYVLSPYMPMNCRYWPSCSAYAAEALSTHGPLKGGRLALRRLLRCHPWGGWGYDPVPEARSLDTGGTSACRYGTGCNSPAHSLPHPAAVQDR